MAFAQLTYRASLRDIEVCLRAQASKLYHMGIRAGVSRNTLANANQVRDWRIYADFAQHLIREARSLYAGIGHGLDLDETVYALDSSTIDLCLSLFPWAHFRKTKVRSSFIPCWTFVATSLPLYMFRKEKCMMSTFWTGWCPSPGPSTSWTVRIWTSRAFIYFTFTEATLYCARNQIRSSGAFSRVRLTAPPG